MCVRDGVWEMVCERWCVKDDGWQRWLTKMVCERCVWRGGGARREEAGKNPGYRIKNKNPTQRCGEKHLNTAIRLPNRISTPKQKKYDFEAIAHTYVSIVFNCRFDAATPMRFASRGMHSKVPSSTTEQYWRIQTQWTPMRIASMELQKSILVEKRVNQSTAKPSKPQFHCGSGDGGDHRATVAANLSHPSSED